ncbi:nuclear pore complex protein NUP62-like [Sitophilus oryzae]|uniref:Nuclear pore complex protein NUP62-like n=1 Tax=Sitophilus oryzae TaxID=7048 RepID=A0A6J2X3V1_SITOR|nr:nuclear pore complex protein NUP62-like [Sitophilus oryzae]
MGFDPGLGHCFKCFVVFVVAFSVLAECRKVSGGSRSWGSSSRITHSRPTYSAPSRQTYHPSSSSSHPNPVSLSYPTHQSSGSSQSRPIGFDVNSRHGSSGSSAPVGPPVNSQPLNNAPNFGFNSHSGSQSGSGSNGAPGIGFKPSVTQDAGNIKPSAPVVQISHSRPVGTSNTGSNSNPPAYGFKPSAPVEHASNSRPLGTSNSGTGSNSNPPPYGFKTGAPVGPPTNVKPVGNIPPGAAYPVQPPPYTPHNPGIPPPAYNPAHNPAGYGPPPAYNPSYGGYGGHYNGYGHPQQGGYPNQPHYGAAPGGITNVNINNYNTHNYGGGGFGGGYGGGGLGYASYPSYHYSHSDVGSGALGFFLGYSLAKITTPTYHFTGYSNQYTPRYDHYEVHHYYHNRDAVPAQSTIQPNAIVGCIGDSGSICPAGTTSLCTSNGAILCVASATSTVPCTNNRQGNCVRTTIPCVNGTKDCTTGQNETLTIPCISSAKVMGNITYVNNTIIVNNTTIVNNNGANSTTLTNTTVSTTSSVQNGTDSQENVTTTEVPTTLPPRSKREVHSIPVNDFCVTILALPAERKPTEQEKVLEKGTSFFTKFLVRALGANTI